MFHCVLVTFSCSIQCVGGIEEKLEQFLHFSISQSEYTQMYIHMLHTNELDRVGLCSVKHKSEVEVDLVQVHCCVGVNEEEVIEQ